MRRLWIVLLLGLGACVAKPWPAQLARPGALFVPDRLVLQEATRTSDTSRASVDVSPRLLIAGSSGARLVLRLVGGHLLESFRFDRGDRFELYRSGSATPLELTGLRIVSGTLEGVLVETPEPGTLDLVLDQTERGGPRLRFPRALRVIERLRILMTFDDGPFGGSDPAEEGEYNTTADVLDVLASYRHGPARSKTGIKAAFFVLTTPDQFWWMNFRKADSPIGQRMLRGMHEQGHVVGAHWGGDYRTQKALHLSRVDYPNDNGIDDDGDGRIDEDAPYDVDGDGLPDGTCALESDLIECMNRVEQGTGRRPVFVRPPVWGFDEPARPLLGKRLVDVYELLGLQLVLTDARLADGGYAPLAVFSPKTKHLRNGLRNAVAAGVSDLVVTMHDSNRKTTRRLEHWLRTVESILADIQLGGIPIDLERDVAFVQSTAEVEEILRAKCWYAMFPGTTVRPLARD